MKKIINLFLILFSMTFFLPIAVSADVLPVPIPPPSHICDYAAPPEGCNYVQGPGYDAQTDCGMILKCPTTITDIAKVTRTLRYSMKNDSDVKILQSYLNAIVHTNLVVDGNFGTKTKIVVIAFQNSNSLTADGIVGKLTRAKMVELSQ
jgi:hypothetical protein